LLLVVAVAVLTVAVVVLVAIKQALYRFLLALLTP
jgi:hypothetical protein